MTSSREAIHAFFERAHLSRDIDALWCLFKDALTPFDIAFACYRYFPFPDTTLPLTGQDVSKDDLPQAWTSFYRENTLLDQDMTVQHCFESHAPLLWWHVFAANKQANLPESQKKLYAKMIELGLDLGITLPLPVFPGSGVACVHLFFADVVSQEEARSRWADSALILEAVSRHLHFNVAPFVPGLHDLTLTSKEKDCLLLLLRGRRNKEIAWELDVSEKTVEQRLARIKSKLRSKTTASAVAKALAFRVIEHGIRSGP